jgi:hypothetical protein
MARPVEYTFARYWWAIIIKFPRLLFYSWRVVVTVPLCILFFVALFNQQLAEYLFEKWKGISPWWSVVIIVILLLWGIMWAIFEKEKELYLAYKAAEMRAIKAEQTIGLVESREKLISVRPVLRIKPIAATVPLDWKGKSVLLSKKNGKSPLSILLTNIGNARAIDVEMVFRAPLGAKEIQAELQSSGVFQGFEIRSDKVTVPLQFGKQSSSATLLLGSDDVRAIDAVDFEPGHNEKRVEFPLRTQNGLILWLLSRSYHLGQVRHAKWIQDMRAQEKLFKEKGQIKWTEMWAEYSLQQLQQRQREGVLVCPEITVTISYKDVAGHNFSETHIIKSIYQPTSESFWVIDGEQRYLEGGFGLISFEDKENPSEGFFHMFVGNSQKQ